MKTTLRKLVFISGVCLALPAFAGCRDSAPNPAKKTADVLAEDSTLNLAVVSANQGAIADSLAVAMDSLSAARGSSRTAAGSSGPSVLRTRATPLPSPARSTRAKPSKVASIKRGPASRLSRVRAKSRSGRRVASVRGPGGRNKAIRGSTVRLANSTHRTTKAGKLAVTDAPPKQSGGTFIAGLELSLLSEQRVCSNVSDVGNEFGALVSENVVGTNGMIIPKGATAIAEITSLGNQETGDAIGLRIHSIVFAGKIYPVSSKVTFAEQESVQSARRKTNPKTVAAGAGLGAVLGAVVGAGPPGAILGGAGGAAAGAAIGTRKTWRSESCIPDRGRITARLSEPLTI